MLVISGPRVRLKDGVAGFALRTLTARPRPCAFRIRDGAIFNLCDVVNRDQSRGNAAVPAKIGVELNNTCPRRRVVKAAAVQQTGDPKKELDEGLQASHGDNRGKDDQVATWRPSPLQGAAIMFGVALLWGTSPVCTRYLYLSPEPPSSSILAAVQSTTSALALSAMLFYQDPLAAKQLFLKWKEGRSSANALQVPQLAAEDQQTNGRSIEGQPERTFSWSDIMQYPFPVPTQVRPGLQTLYILNSGFSSSQCVTM